MRQTVPKTAGLLFAVLALSMCATVWLGDNTQGPAPPLKFSVHDTDGDGYLSREEYEVFFQEFEARHTQVDRPLHRMLRILTFEQIDIQRDERVSVDEMVSALLERRKGPGWQWKQPAN